MALSEFERARVARLLGDYAARRVPPDVRDKLRLKHRFRGDTVTLYEMRPPFTGVGNWTSSPVAQFRKERGGRGWSLHWPDRNSRWHPYEDFEAAPDLATLLAEVDRDPTGIFWG